MQDGTVFSAPEIAADPAAIRDYAQKIEGQGYTGWQQHLDAIRRFKEGWPTATG